MKNKKGIVIGKTLSTIVTLIVISFIMGLFVFAALSVAALKKPNVEQSQSVVSTTNFLFNPTNLNDPTNPEKKQTVMDIVTEIGIIGVKLENIVYRREMSVEERRELEEREETLRGEIIKEMEETNLDKICFIVFRKVSGGSGETLDINIMKQQGKVWIPNTSGVAVNYRNNGKLTDFPPVTSKHHGIESTFELKIYYGPCDPY